MKKIMIILSVYLITELMGIDVFAHGTNHHAQPSTAHSDNHMAFQKIAETYNQSVRPIFEKKCLDCHGSTTNYPWYYKIPGAKQLIDHDLHEAKEHIDMSHGFPFKGHGSSPSEDLKAIQEEVEEGDMPPFRYWVLHWGSRISSEEKEVIIQWVRTSLAELESAKK